MLRPLLYAPSPPLLPLPSLHRRNRRFDSSTESVCGRRRAPRAGGGGAWPRASARGHWPQQPAAVEHRGDASQRAEPRRQRQGAGWRRHCGSCARQAEAVRQQQAGQGPAPSGHPQQRPQTAASRCFSSPFGFQVIDSSAPSPGLPTSVFMQM